VTTSIHQVTMTASEHGVDIQMEPIYPKGSLAGLSQQQAYEAGYKTGVYEALFDLQREAGLSQEVIFAALGRLTGDGSTSQ